ncbi:MAG: Uncharacterised protein [Prochlorococcus marinus str. MIT 9215]|nr:MAG: Uncharacterised protein [Prochlorococcus marinus str. MIT 9215]
MGNQFQAARGLIRKPGQLIRKAWQLINKVGRGLKWAAHHGETQAKAQRQQQKMGSS